MTHSLDTCWCDGCGVEITWSPITHQDRQYCCRDCLERLPCDCGQRMEQEDDRRGRVGEAVGFTNLAGE